jgi:hypothetical protein
MTTTDIWDQVKEITDPRLAPPTEGPMRRQSFVPVEGTMSLMSAAQLPVGWACVVEIPSGHDEPTFIGSGPVTYDDLTHIGITIWGRLFLFRRVVCSITLAEES